MEKGAFLMGKAETLELSLFPFQSGGNEKKPRMFNFLAYSTEPWHLIHSFLLKWSSLR